LKRIRRKKYKNHLRSNDYEVCTAAAHCVPNILDAIILENIKSEDKIGRPALWCNERELEYADSSVSFNHTLISYVHWT
jgi:hypothetical protein